MNNLQPGLDPTATDTRARFWLRWLGLIAMHLFPALALVYLAYIDIQTSNALVEEMLSRQPPDVAQRIRVTGWVFAGLVLLLAFVVARYGSAVLRAVCWPLVSLHRRTRRRVPRGRPR